MKKAIINKILYTVGNDLALFCLLVAVYYLPRIIPYNLALILLIIVFITAVFCFYLVRVFTVIGDIYDEDYNAVYVFLTFINTCKRKRAIIPSGTIARSLMIRLSLHSRGTLPTFFV